MKIYGNCWWGRRLRTTSTAAVTTGLSTTQSLRLILFFSHSVSPQRTGLVQMWKPRYWHNPRLSDFYWAVSDSTPRFGVVLHRTTCDDVVGMRYLISQTNVNVETLDDSILPADGNASGLVRMAPRPGVEKITFVRHATNALGSFVIVTKPVRRSLLHERVAGHATSLPHRWETNIVFRLQTLASPFRPLTKEARSFGSYRLAEIRHFALGQQRGVER